MYYVAITTRNREESFYNTYNAVKKYTDNIIVVDDASDNPYFKADFRFNERVGIPKVKNKCIELFMTTKCEHLFMLDDDVLPIHENSFNDYIESGINHLCYTFLNPLMVKDGLKYHRLGNGCMMYFNRVCFEKLGGFDTNFGLGKYEHVDFSRRINNYGLTTRKFIDLAHSATLWKSLDEDGSIERSFDKQEMDLLLKQGHHYFFKQVDSKEFKPYK